MTTSDFVPERLVEREFHRIDGCPGDGINGAVVGQPATSAIGSSEMAAAVAMTRAQNTVNSSAGYDALVVILAQWDLQRATHFLNADERVARMHSYCLVTART